MSTCCATPLVRDLGALTRMTLKARSALACVLLAIPVGTVAVHAAEAQQPVRGDRVTVRAGSALRSGPKDDVIGVASRTITGTVETVQGGAVRLTVSGHVSAADVELTADRTRGTVTPSKGSTLRLTGASNAAAVAELREGTFVFPGTVGGKFPPDRNSGFFQVRRALWVDMSRLQAGGAVESTARPAPSRAAAAASGNSAAAAQATPAATPTTAAPTAAPTAPPGPLIETAGPTTLQTAPRGAVLATIPGGVPLTTLAREGGYVRVRLEGWVPDSAVAAAGTRSAGALSAADLRADPTGTQGRLVRWSVETLAFQRADQFRSGLALDEPYLLARGPGAERAVLYLAIPDSLLTRAQALPPLTEISITARVRNGRSLPAGVPILDLLDLARR